MASFFILVCITVLTHNISSIINLFFSKYGQTKIYRYSGGMVKAIHNPHDKLFKNFLQNKTLAKHFFKNFLPKKFQEKVNLETLSLQKGSFVDDRLSEHLTDLLYKVKIANKVGYLYLLVEHQSTTDELMAFRLLKDMTNIMDQHLATHKTKRLPLIFPIVYYTGVKPSKGFKRDILDCFEAPELAKQYFMKPFELIDLQKMSDDDLLKDKATAGLTMIQKHVQRRDVSLGLDNLLKNGVFIVLNESGGECLEGVLQYLVSQAELERPEQFFENLSL